MEDKRIYVTEADAVRLRKVIETGRDSWNTDSDYLEILEEELDQAHIVPAAQIPADVVTMRSQVRLSDIDSGKEMTYRLVFPHEANIQAGNLSVLAPIGTALLGYRVGDIIEWSTPGGVRRLRVEQILYQPEAAGDLA